MEINTSTKLTGLFGHPVEHTLSPLFMNFIFNRLNLNSRYIAFDIKQENIKDALHSLRILGFKGVNVTIPYKQSVFKSIESLSDDAMLIGAVNCIVNKNGLLYGHNTDHLGFIKPLGDRDLKIRDESAIIIGCGGAARSVLYALMKKGIYRIYLINRTKKNADNFILWSKETLQFKEITYIGDKNALSQGIVNDTALIINTTPVGMFPDIKNNPLPEGITFKSGHIVYDLIYNPDKTAILKKAEKEGAQAINGFEMLILQGLYSCGLWFPDKKEQIFSIQRKVMSYTKKQFETVP